MTPLELTLAAHGEASLIERTIADHTNDDAEPEHGIGLRMTADW